MAVLGHHPMVAIVGVIVAANLFLRLELSHAYLGEVSTSSDPLQEAVWVLSQPAAWTSNRTRARRRRPRLPTMPIDRAALAVGSIRLASGISFLVDPRRANRLWGDSKEPTPSGLLLLHSMGYRDALIGGLLTAAALRGKDTRGWFLASGGADAADLFGGSRVHDGLTRPQRVIGLGGAVVGIGVGLWGAMRRPPDTPTRGVRTVEPARR